VISDQFFNEDERVGGRFAYRLVNTQFSLGPQLQLGVSPGQAIHALLSHSEVRRLAWDDDDSDDPWVISKVDWCESCFRLLVVGI
jgi:hypothetical protein